jgi:hypothetical protein
MSSSLPSPRWQTLVLWQKLAAKIGPNADEIRSTTTLCLNAATKILDKGSTAASDFTLHDSDHSFRVAEKMSEIVPAGTLEELSPYELAFLLLSAYLHDIGMTPARSRAVAHYEFLITGIAGLLGEKDVGEFQQWLDQQPEAVAPPLAKAGQEPATIDQLRTARELVTYYCRERHNDWSAEWIRENLSPFPLASYALWIDDLITLCRSHHEGFQELVADKFDARIVGASVVNLRYLASVLRVADILDIDPERTPTVILRHRGISDKSLIYWYKDQNLSVEIVGNEVVAFARPSNAKLHKAIIETLDDIDRELETCFLVNLEKPYGALPRSTRSLPYAWSLQRKCSRNVAPKDAAYEFMDGAFRPDTRKLLDLLSGVALYQSELAAVRELLQNAFDAVEVQIALQRLGHSNPLDKEFVESLRSTHEVVLSLDVVDGEPWLACTDTGVGMTKKIIEKYLLVSGSRRPPETIELARRCHKAGFPLNVTGQFGIGVLSYFMLCDRLTMRTFRSREASAGSPEANGWYFESEGVGSFGELRRDGSFSRGTELRLRLRPEVLRGTLEDFSAELRGYLSPVLTRTPCSFVLRLHGSDTSCRWGPGWTSSAASIAGRITRLLRRTTEDEDVPKELLGPRDKERKEAEAARADTLRSEVGASLRLASQVGELPNGLGHYAIHFPYFELAGDFSMVFLRVTKADDTIHISRIAEGFAFWPSWTILNSWKGMSLSVNDPDSAMWSYRHSAPPAVIEADWTSEEAGELSVNRNTLEASPKLKQTLEWLKGQASSLGQHLIDTYPASPYALLSCNAAGAQLPDKIQPSWLHIEDEESFAWSKIDFPATPSASFGYLQPQPATLNEKPVSALWGVSERDDPDHYKGVSFASAGAPPDRICKITAYKFSVAPVWCGPTVSRPRHTAGIPTAAFPPNWASVCGVQLSPPGTQQARPLAGVWNSEHPLIRLVDADSWQWATERFAGVHNPEKFRAELLARPALAASWLLYCLLGARQQIFQRVPELAKGVWKLLGETIPPNEWTGEILHWVEDSGADSRLRIVTASRWDPVYWRSEKDRATIEARLPDPGPEWTVEVPRPPMRLRTRAIHK